MADVQRGADTEPFHFQHPGYGSRLPAASRYYTARPWVEQHIGPIGAAAQPPHDGFPRGNDSQASGAQQADIV